MIGVNNMAEKAYLDVTYCVNTECKNKCWRNMSNYEFEKDNNYWFMEICEPELMKKERRNLKW